MRARLGLVVLASTLAAGCATIPSRQYGVSSLSVSGMEQLDDAALKVCLATQARERFSFTFGAAGEPECGVPPFYARGRVDLWTWPWTGWPVYDETVWNRDVARVTRWFRARGYYDARVTHVAHRMDGAHHTVDLTLHVAENKPVLVQSISLEGVGALDTKTRERLMRRVQLRVGEPFDEALHDDTKRALVDALRERAYAQAAVEGTVRIDTALHEATVVYRVALGRRFRFGRVSVEGQGNLPRKPIWAAAQIEEGSPFSVSALEDAKRAVYELGSFASVETIENPRTDQDRVDIVIKVVPGRRIRVAFGGGLQVGTDPTLTPTDAPSDSLNRWDLHLLARLEYRNFLGGMRRLSIEERPRVLFDRAFPDAHAPHLGNLLIVDFRQPTFLEARTSFGMTARWDHGPDPYTYVMRSDVLAGAGPERTFLDGKLRLTATLNVNLFFPIDGQPQQQADRIYYPRYYATYLQYSASLDLRDAPREPRRGAYLALTVQQAGYFLPSDWDYVRVTPDARGYLPLGPGVVLAGRVRLGYMEISHSSIEVGTEDTYGVRQRLRDLGPLRQRLRGGGNNSVRGYQPNTLGDITRVFDVIDSGGLRQWEASLELRAAITSSFGAVVFADIGDVTTAHSFRFSAPQPSFGFGLRYRTLIGPIRFDVGFAPKGLQYIGNDDPRTRESLNALGMARDFHESQFLGTQGAVHFTIGEAY